MGLFDNLFGGKSDYFNAISTMEKGYAGVRTYANEAYGKLITEFGKERAANAKLYADEYSKAVTKYEADMARTMASLSAQGRAEIAKFGQVSQATQAKFAEQMKGTISQYGDTLTASREAFKAAGAEAYKTLESGRESTLALLQQQTDAAVARQTMSSMLTGLSNTTFGQSAINAVATQGALQAGAVKEQYAQSLYAAQMAQASALAQMEQQAATGIMSAQGQTYGSLASMANAQNAAQFSAGMNLVGSQTNLQAQQAQMGIGAGLGRTQYLSDQYQKYAAAGLGLQGGNIQSQIGLQTRPIEARYAAETQKAMMDMQSGQMFGGALLGAGIGAIAEGIGQGAGNILSPFASAFGGGGR